MNNNMKIFRSISSYSVDENNSLTGVPIVFESLTDLGDHYEIIKRGALDEADLSDISFLINHNFNNLPIARYRAGDANSTLQIDIQDDGLHFETELDPSNPRSSEVLSCIKRKDIQKMSFGFLLERDNPAACHWLENPGDKPTLVITRILAVFDISVVTWPAYDDTSVQMKRSKEVDEFEDTNVFDLYTSQKRNADFELLKLKALAKFPK